MIWRLRLRSMSDSKGEASGVVAGAEGMRVCKLGGVGRVRMFMCD